MSDPKDIDVEAPEYPSEAAARASQNVTPESLTYLFERLSRAHGQWGAFGARVSAVTALRALNEFFRFSARDMDGTLSRTFDLLQVELENSPDALPGCILPPVERDQTSETSQRARINEIKAAAAIAVEKLVQDGELLKKACWSVAGTLFDYGFPREDFLEGACAPSRSDLAERVKRWRDNYPRNPKHAGETFRQLAEPVVPAWARVDGEDVPNPLHHYTLDWLERELKRAGFEK